MGFKEIKNYQLRPVKPQIPVQPVPAPVPDPEPHTYVQTPEPVPTSPPDTLETLFEPIYVPVLRTEPNPEPEKRKFTITIPKLPKLDISRFMFWKKQKSVLFPVIQKTHNITGSDMKLSTKSLLIRLIISGILIYFGITTSGSYFGAVSARLTGDFARLFYSWGMGYLMAMIGLIIVYDTYKHYY